MICEGCLSEDRAVSIVDKENLRIYASFLDDECTNNSVKLCWECRALLKKFLRFKQQVRCAHSTLVRYSVPRYKCLSNLKTTECKHTIDIDNEREIVTATFVKIEIESSTSLADSYHDELADHLSADEDDSFNNDPKGNDDAEKTYVRDDSSLETPELKSKAKKRSQTTDVFDESDDEPLKDKTKPKAKRDKKNEGAARRGGRRQQAPGVVSSAKVLRKLQRLNADADQLEMVVLSWDQVEEERQKALKSHVFLRHEHRCYTCVVGFNHRCKLDDHIAKKHDPSLGTVECSVCNVRLANVFGLRAHRRRHVARWRCRLCGAMWSRAEIAADHVSRAHGGNTPVHTCHVCGQRETTLGRLRIHVSTHSEKQKCELCGKMFRNKESLRTHLFIHKGEKEHACPRCDKKFLFKKAMEVHCISHDASSQLYCYECDVNFKNQMSFNQHMKYTLKHVDPAKLKHACELCDKRFVKAVRLQEHKLAVHLKQTPIACSQPGCTFACSSKPVLRTHVRMLHRNARARRDHVCDVCGKAYSTKKILEGHLHSHSGARPYRCTTCPAAFGYQAALYNHNKLVHLKNKTGRGRGAAPAWPVAEEKPAPLPVDQT
ncbi:zinc finger protein 846-like [Pararge aegeria]|uniref:zinc finger protein 846-like n=1 Tax=Pararge aegeria TaxID=116150 RepID=UPI0019D0D36A|nr:zinc finger protein 846-like [Pararge aegeria]